MFQPRENAFHLTSSFYLENKFLLLGCVFFECKKNTENILHYDECSGWPENSIKWKSFPLTIKYQPLRCKINYTSNLPSNHLHPFSSSTRIERERERERGEHLQWSMERAGALKNGSNHCVDPVNNPPRSQSDHHKQPTLESI